MRHSLIAILAFWTGAAAPAWAQTDRLQPDFTFRRVVAPPSGATGRITVQIDPTAPSARGAPPGAARPSAADDGAEPADVAMAPVAPSELDWFWAAVSPRMEDSGPGRLLQGLAALEEAPAATRLDGPPLQSLSDIARSHGRDILRETVGKQVSPALVLAVISVESGGRAGAESGAGAQGLMQLIPATAERFGVSDSFDTAQNIRGGVAYLDWLMGEFDGDPILALAGYNAGEGAVRTHAGVPPYAETRAYVPKVLAAWKVARGLCQTPPELMTDGCVFAVQGEMP